MTGLFRKIGQALLASLLFLIVLALVYLAHARFFPVDVVFRSTFLTSWMRTTTKYDGFVLSQQLAS